MKTAAIIAEYNPFHNGHAYLMEEAGRLTGADRIIVIMSGDFVQRGEPAVCDKYQRTRMALECGADAVFEMPVAYTCSSAEIFAEAGVKLAYTLGCIDYLVFGSESGNIDDLMSAADILVREPGSFRDVLSAELRKGLNYPAAREEAFRSSCPDASLADLLKEPNNILALEYCKAIIKLRGLNSIQKDRIPTPLTVKRIGSGYSDSTLSDMTYPSATALRKLFKDSLSDSASPHGSMNLPESLHDIPGVPETVNSALIKGYGSTMPIAANSLSDMLFIRLNTVSDRELSETEGMTPDLLNMIQKIKEEPVCFLEAIEKIKAKSTTYSGISRLLLHILLGVDRSYATLLKTSPELPYARLLGLKTSSSDVLRPVSDLLGSGLITKLADYERSNPLLLLDIRAAHIYNQLVYSSFGTVLPDEYRSNIVRI